MSRRKAANERFLRIIGLWSGDNNFPTSLESSPKPRVTREEHIARLSDDDGELPSLELVSYENTLNKKNLLR
jgi:hypothetical protein